MNELLTCAICGAMSLDVTVALCAWRDGDVRFTSEPRCKDHAACRRRVEARGERWPLEERVD